MMDWTNFNDLNSLDIHNILPNPRVLVIGCGGAGNNSINRLHVIGIEGAETLAVNTDKIHLENIEANGKVLIGSRITKGRGAGGDPRKGEWAAEESSAILNQFLEGVDMAFITVGMGGGTGTGSAPVVSEIAKKHGAIVIAIATTPFTSEGGMRRKRARDGLARLKESADCTIILDNNKLLDLVPDAPLNQAFSVMDCLISDVIKSVTETITQTSMINLDYADVRATLEGTGTSSIIFGESTTAEGVVSQALNNPLLDVDFAGATGALVHITAGPELSIKTTNKVVGMMTEHLGEDANIIFGARVDDAYRGKIKLVCIIAGVPEPLTINQPPTNQIFEASTANTGASISPPIEITR